MVLISVGNFINFCLVCVVNEVTFDWSIAFSLVNKALETTFVVILRPKCNLQPMIFHGFGASRAVCQKSTDWKRLCLQERSAKNKTKAKSWQIS